MKYCPDYGEYLYFIHFLHNFYNSHSSEYTLKINTAILCISLLLQFFKIKNKIGYNQKTNYTLIVCLSIRKLATHPRFYQHN